MKSRNESLADDLEALGFHKYSPGGASKLRSEVLKVGHLAVFGDSGRMFHADAEDLAEGGVSKFLRRISPMLSALRVEQAQVDDDFDAEHYDVVVGSRRYKIWSQDESEESWGFATARTFSLVNELLKKGRSTEMMYALNGGNDLEAFFLTRDLHRMICGMSELERRDQPYLPTEVPPYFGYSDE